MPAPNHPSPLSAESTPSSLDEDRAARRARTLANLDAALAAAGKLGEIIGQAFPEAAKACKPLPAGLSVDERLKMGEAVAAELTTVAMQLAPELTLDSLEANLAGDHQSHREAAELLGRMAQASA